MNHKKSKPTMRKRHKQKGMPKVSWWSRMIHKWWLLDKKDKKQSKYFLQERYLP